MVSAREHKTEAQVSGTGTISAEKNKNAEVIKDADPEKKKKSDPQFDFSSMGSAKISSGQTSVGQTKPQEKTPAKSNINYQSILTPKDNFPGRSKTRFGVGEEIHLDVLNTDMGFVPALEIYPYKFNDYNSRNDNIPSKKDPSKSYEKDKSDWEAKQKKSNDEHQHPSAEKLGGLEWIAVGGGTISNTSPGKATYTAPEKAAAVTLALRNSTSKEIVHLKSIQIVAPDNGYVKRNSTVAPQLWHLANHVSAGFIGDFYLEPKDVSFSAVLFREGECDSTIVGKGGFPNQRHDPGTEGPFPVAMQMSASEGSKAILIDHAQMLYSAADSVNTGGKKIAHSSLTWKIPWTYRVGAKGTKFTFAHIEQFGEGHETGKMDVSKGGSGLFSQELKDPEFNQAPYIIYPAFP